MKQIGKKGKEWQKARVLLIKEGILSGRLTVIENRVLGLCTDCGCWKPLTPDHRKKRSQGGTHDSSNIDWVCLYCHDLRDNQGDPMNKKDKKQKPDWSKDHKCKNCGVTVAFLLCPHCKRLSA